MTEQLGFGFEKMAEEARDAHLPATMEEAIPNFRTMIDRHHAAMLAADEPQVKAIRKEMHRMARKLNNGEPGILAPDGPGTLLEKETAAPVGTVPLWGQAGDFNITVGEMPVRITMDGMFGIGASVMFWPGFAAHVVDDSKPFLSETGYRSFHGYNAAPAPNMTPDTFAAEAVRSFIAGECKGRLRAIKPEYRGRG